MTLCVAARVCFCLTTEFVGVDSVKDTLNVYLCCGVVWVGLYTISPLPIVLVYIVWCMTYKKTTGLETLEHTKRPVVPTPVLDAN